MKSSIRLLSLLCGLPFLGVAVSYAQEVPGGNALVREWIRSQRQVAEQVDSIAFTQIAQRYIEGPFGTRRTETTTLFQGTPQQERWQRTLQAVVVEGRTVPPERHAETEQQWRSLLRPGFYEFLNNTILPQRLFARMRAVASPSAETLDGQTLWRLEVAPREERGPMERATLWFDQDTGALRQSRTIVHPPSPGEATLVITVTYARIAGLDVPSRRHIEGNLSIKRRLRFFTALIDFEASFEDYQITMK